LSIPYHISVYADFSGQEIYGGKSDFLLLAGKRREKKSPRSSSSKKIIAYAAIGIIALAAVSVTAFSPRPTPADPEEDQRQQTIRQFQEMFCGDDTQAMSTQYLTEYVLPQECEVPLAMEVTGDKVWYVSTKHGTIGSYNVASKTFEKEYEVPSWSDRANPVGTSMSRSAKADNDGNIWFTDESQGAIWKFDISEGSFDMYRVPAKLPTSIDFDSQGRIYFVGVQSTSIFVGDPARMRNGTAEGITEVPLPLDTFAGMPGVTSGALTVDDENNEVWVSLLAFERKGQLLVYDIGTGEVTPAKDLPREVTSPVGLAIDASGDIWVTDHGTSLFFRYDRESGQVTRFVTSVASPRIYAGIDQPSAYTLPYWIERSPDSPLLWFNEHTGNKIASFDPASLVLTEYWVPSQNENWARCPPDSSNPCGLANVLEIASASGGQIWFSEWTENKIGVVDGTKAVPISVSVQEEELTVSREDSVEIRVTLEAASEFDGTMMAASTLTPTGRLGNSTGIFSEESVSLQSGSSKQVSYVFTPTENLQPGKHTIMVGAGDNEVSVLKAVIVNIV
jgi:virginiamycin B lyase